MSDPERAFFQQEALGRFPDKPEIAGQNARRETFVEGAMFASQFYTRQREILTDEAKLRDEFAMAALPGFMAANADCEYMPEALARAIFEIADAMMGERARVLADG